jgi:hypothetical protein
MEVFDAQHWAIGLALKETIEKREILQRNGVKMVPVIAFHKPPFGGRPIWSQALDSG